MEMNEARTFIDNLFPMYISANKSVESVTPSPVSDKLFDAYVKYLLGALKSFDDFEKSNPALAGGESFAKSKKDFLLPAAITNAQR